MGHTASVTTTQLSHCSVNADTDSMRMNERGCTLTKLYWWELKFDCHIVFMYHEVLILIFFQPLKTMQKPFCLWAVQKQMVGWIWPASPSLPTIDRYTTIALV